MTTPTASVSERVSAGAERSDTETDRIASPASTGSVTAPFDQNRSITSDPDTLATKVGSNMTSASAVSNVKVAARMWEKKRSTSPARSLLPEGEQQQEQPEREQKIDEVEVVDDGLDNRSQSESGMPYNLSQIDRIKGTRMNVSRNRHPLQSELHGIHSSIGRDSSGDDVVAISDVLTETKLKTQSIVAKKITKLNGRNGGVTSCQARLLLLKGQQQLERQQKIEEVEVEVKLDDLENGSNDASE
eukprot:8988216-Ditylum_brightwellii.AAC.1